MSDSKWNLLMRTIIADITATGGGKTTGRNFPEIERRISRGVPVLIFLPDSVSEATNQESNKLAAEYSKFLNELVTKKGRFIPKLHYIHSKSDFEYVSRQIHYFRKLYSDLSQCEGNESPVFLLNEHALYYNLSAIRQLIDILTETFECARKEMPVLVIMDDISGFWRICGNLNRKEIVLPQIFSPSKEELKALSKTKKLLSRIDSRQFLDILLYERDSLTFVNLGNGFTLIFFDLFERTKDWNADAIITKADMELTLYWNILVRFGVIPEEMKFHRRNIRRKHTVIVYPYPMNSGKSYTKHNRQELMAHYYNFRQKAMADNDNLLVIGNKNIVEFLSGGQTIHFNEVGTNAYSDLDRIFLCGGTFLEEEAASALSYAGIEPLLLPLESICQSISRSALRSNDEKVVRIAVPGFGHDFPLLMKALSRIGIDPGNIHIDTSLYGQNKCPVVFHSYDFRNCGELKSCEYSKFSIYDNYRSTEPINCFDFDVNRFLKTCSYYSKRNRFAAKDEAFNISPSFFVNNTEYFSFIVIDIDAANVKYDKFGKLMERFPYKYMLIPSFSYREKVNRKAGEKVSYRYHLYVFLERAVNRTLLEILFDHCTKLLGRIFRKVILEYKTKEEKEAILRKESRIIFVDRSCISSRRKFVISPHAYRLSPRNHKPISLETMSMLANMESFKLHKVYTNLDTRGKSEKEKELADLFTSMLKQRGNFQTLISNGTLAKVIRTFGEHAAEDMIRYYSPPEKLSNRLSRLRSLARNCSISKDEFN